MMERSLNFLIRIFHCRLSDQSIVEMKIKLEAINGVVSETRTDVKATANEMNNLHAHMSTVDEKLNNVTARVDDLEEHVFHKGILPVNA